MSFLKKIFGASSFADERTRADQLFEKERYEDARIAYQRALDKKKDANADGVAHCEERIAECLDQMAEVRIAEAQALVSAGHLDLAEAELRNAMETAASEEIAKRARRVLETLEKEDALRLAEAPAAMSNDDRYAILAGSWEPEQIEEYDEYGEAMRDALLALNGGAAKEAREALEALLAENEEDACYLWLEVGRARLATEDEAGAEEALRAFLESLEEEEGGDARLAAHGELGMIRDRADDEEGAIAELQEAMDAFPDDPRPFFLMGRYLRSKGHGQESADVLEAGLPFLSEERPDAGFLQEVGLAHLLAGNDEEAAAFLDRVIAQAVALRRGNADVDFPPETAIARAQLFEKEGALERAADLYRALARGSDRERHLFYHREAGRLLMELELYDEARRMLTRALALAESDADARTALEAQLAELE